VLERPRGGIHCAISALVCIRSAADLHLSRTSNDEESIFRMKNLIFREMQLSRDDSATGYMFLDLDRRRLYECYGMVQDPV
jgi:hypothetical protein